MKSETIHVQQLFQDRRQFRVPFYQRTYVWNREDQWERLWADIQEKAEARLQGGHASPHFLGAAVLEPQQRKGLLGVETLHIIDGQQRLTTLQYVLAGLAMNLRAQGHLALLSLVDACLRNSNAETMEEPEVEAFKVWPTFRDRLPYQEAMTAESMTDLRNRFPLSFTQTGTLRKVGIDHPPALEAVHFYADRAASWIDADGQATGPRATALVEAVLRDLHIVTISLGENDDAQIIFETLNGHGAQLHATDLIRNFVFMRADREGSPTTKLAELYDSLWSPFETSFWVEDQRRGRLRKPRLEWFIQAALQATLGEEIDIGRLYVNYRKFAFGTTPPVRAEQQLMILNQHAENYRHLVSGSGNSPIARFGLDVAAWDASTTYPFAMAVAASSLSVDEQGAIFRVITSYLVRRAVCNLSPKNYNKIFGQLLKKAREESLSVGTMRSLLASFSGDSSRWPLDDEFRRSWLEASIYPGRLDTPRVRWLLASIERGLRSPRTEEPVPLALESLDVDHILPISWFEHWHLTDGTKATSQEVQAAVVARFGEQAVSARYSSILRREQLKVSMGNLTLLHYGVNRGLQNHSFLKKREALFGESHLQLNRELMRASEWNEEAIERRGRKLFEVAQRLWPSPDAS
jgi:hypothetical protein